MANIVGIGIDICEILRVKSYTKSITFFPKNINGKRN